MKVPTRRISKWRCSVEASVCFWKGFSDVNEVLIRVLHLGGGGGWKHCCSTYECGNVLSEAGDQIWVEG